MICLQVNKTHATSTQEQEEPERNILAEEANLHTTITSRKSTEKLLHTFSFNGRPTERPPLVGEVSAKFGG
jgi:hypothetical protein